ncbi:MAG: bifunctional adenosylcobinamide kinase/adenosylcobinamide-phosphate guanylyltransferase [Clostridia bacterium]|nr:bifunctional adenosylcobinamide kinase/adenosylcobinamide-phosphate guanylyltransferase [Clostridia bacterium]
MGKLILVTGGARSGKSSFAEETAAKLGHDVLYIATAIAFDDEMKLRIKKHREQRPQHWETLEAYKDLDTQLMNRTAGKSAIMLDCITVMISNLMFEEEVNWENIRREDAAFIEEKIRNQTEKLLSAIRNTNVPFILVTNEVGMGIVPENALSRLFRDIAGRCNQMLAKAADEVYFCVSGIPTKLK